MVREQLPGLPYSWDGQATLGGSSCRCWSGFKLCKHVHACLHMLAHTWLKIYIKIPAKGYKPQINCCSCHPSAGVVLFPSHPPWDPSLAHLARLSTMQHAVCPSSSTQRQTDRWCRGGEVPLSEAGSWGQPGACGGLEVPPPHACSSLTSAGAASLTSGLWRSH